MIFKRAPSSAHPVKGLFHDGNGGPEPAARDPRRSLPAARRAGGSKERVPQRRPLTVGTHLRECRRRRLLPEQPALLHVEAVTTTA
ncbi:hypothetical protein GCM10020001_001310 [Nonomuraea salmonea]